MLVTVTVTEAVLWVGVPVIAVSCVTPCLTPVTTTLDPTDVSNDMYELFGLHVHIGDAVLGVGTAVTVAVSLMLSVTELGEMDRDVASIIPALTRNSVSSVIVPDVADVDVDRYSMFPVNR